MIAAWGRREAAVDGDARVLLGSHGGGLLGSHKAVYTSAYVNRYTAITVVRSGKVSVMVVMGLSTCSDTTSKSHVHLSRRLLHRQWPGHVGATEEKNV
jgi:hypothetical protein